MSDEFDSWQLEGRKYMRDVAVQRRSRRDTKQARSSHWNKNPKPRYGAFRTAVRGACYTQSGTSAHPVIINNKSGCRCCRYRIRASNPIRMPREHIRNLDRCYHVCHCNEPCSRDGKNLTIAAVIRDSCIWDSEVDDNESDSKNWNLAALDQGSQCDMRIPEMAPAAITSFSGYAAKLARFLGFGYSTLDQLSATTSLAPDDFDFFHDENQEEDWVVLTT